MSMVGSVTAPECLQLEDEKALFHASWCGVLWRHSIFLDAYS